FAKAQIGAGVHLPDMRSTEPGTVFLSVRDEDKRHIVSLAGKLQDLGFKLLATSGTARALNNSGITAERVFKIHEGRPHVLDLIKNNQVTLIVNTPSGRLERSDDRLIRSAAVALKVPCITTLAGAAATVQALSWLRKRPLDVTPLQEHHARLRAAARVERRRPGTRTPRAARPRHDRLARRARPRGDRMVRAVRRPRMRRPRGASNAAVVHEP